MAVTTQNLSEFRSAAADFLLRLSPQKKAATVVALSGELGAGKTTFVQEIAKALGITETVSSPTFVIEKIYETTDARFQKLIHIDAYRLKSGKELKKLGWEDLVKLPNTLILIEWPEVVADALPKGTVRVSFKHTDAEMREIIW